MSCGHNRIDASSSRAISKNSDSVRVHKTLSNQRFKAFLDVFDVAMNEVMFGQVITRNRKGPKGS
jgi:hypothetical protein